MAAADAGPFIQMPGALSYPMNMGIYDWGFPSEPEPHLGSRRLATPRGKVIGGSSSINGMVYVRGHARDFDTWAEMGARWLALCRCAALFQADGEQPRRAGPPNWRGSDGPLHITRGPRRTRLFDAFIEAGRQAGYPVTADYNGAAARGLWPDGGDDLEGPPLVGRQCLSETGAEPPAMSHVTRGFARRVVIEDGRAVGVEVDTRGRIARSSAPGAR